MSKPNKTTAELDALLDTCKGQPFTPPNLSFEFTRVLLEKIVELGQKVDAATESAGTTPKYLPADKLGKRYGMTAKGISPYLLRWTASGAVKRIAPVHPATGRAGVPRYLVADVDKMMEQEPERTRRR